MTSEYSINESGSTAVEFALVAPILVAIIIFVLQLAVAVQRWTALQTASDATARCMAISGTGCTTAAGGAAYAVQAATNRGVPGMTASMVTIGAGAIGSVAMVTVAIRYPLAFAGFNLTFNISGSFPTP